MEVARWPTITRQPDLIVSHCGNPSEHDTASGLETMAGTPPYLISRAITAARGRWLGGGQRRGGIGPTGWWAVQGSNLAAPSV